MVTMVLTAQSGLVQGSAQLYADLAAALSRGDNIALDTTNLAYVDLSFLQLIEVVRRHVSDRGGTITLSEAAGEQLRDTLDRAGLSATFTPADRTFWFHEGQRT